VVAKPLLIEAGATAVLDAASDAGLLALGFPDDWQQRGLGVVRAAIAPDTRPPVLAVRNGTRPSGLSPDIALTRFRWTFAGSQV
jgi:hypothetical protein